MASLGKRSSGKFFVRFVGIDDERYSVALDTKSAEKAADLKRRIESLISAATNGLPLDSGTAAWAASVKGNLRSRLEAVGLLQPLTGAGRMTLGSWLDSYIAIKNVKGSTKTVYGHTRRNLIEYFGADKPLADVTEHDVDAWRDWLGNHEEKRKDKNVSVKLGKNTISRRCGLAKQFLAAAVADRRIAENPFKKMKGIARQRNRSRDYFVTTKEADLVLAACPDAEWRLLFALSRYGGLRCPSEHLRLRWCDVNWETGRILVHSPKTEHHEGKATRFVPIFPELRPYLEKVWERAEANTFWVITRYRCGNANLRTQLHRIIELAGLTPWPKLFQNLRSTRQTELEEKFPSHVVCAWIGNSEKVAREHYLQVTDEHFERAARAPALHYSEESCTTSEERGETSPRSREIFTTPHDSHREWAAQDSNL